MPESASAVLASARTGETCRQPGPYRSGGRLGLTVFFKRGDRFPNDTEGRSTGWTLVTEATARQNPGQG